MIQGVSQQASDRRPDHGSRATLERDGDRSPRVGKPNSVVAPNKDLRAVFAPLVDYGDDSDEEGEPESPGKSGKQHPCVCLVAVVAFTGLVASVDINEPVSPPCMGLRSVHTMCKSAAASGILHVTNYVIAICCGRCKLDLTSAHDSIFAIVFPLSLSLGVLTHLRFSKSRCCWHGTLHA